MSRVEPGAQELDLQRRCRVDSGATADQRGGPGLPRGAAGAQSDGRVDQGAYLHSLGAFRGPGGPEDLAARAWLRIQAQDDRRIKVNFLQRNLGISGNSNRALELATGEYWGCSIITMPFAPFACTKW